MEKKLDEIKEHIYEIKLDLREHMARTEIAEKHLKLLENEFEPVRKAYNGAKWASGTIIILGAVVTSLVKLGVIK